MRSYKRILLTLVFSVASVSMYQVMADPPTDNPPPPPGGGHGGGGNAQGAPIDGGMGILITLGAAYGLTRLRRSRKKGQEAAEEEPGIPG